MARSIWKKTLVTSFAWAGLAWAQQPTSLAPTVPANAPATITVQEQGRPAQRCKVLKNWKTPQGATAYQVQALDTGEILTIVETGTVSNVQGSRMQALSTRIFHWGRDRTPPPGTPMAPVEYAQTAPPPVASQIAVAPQYTQNTPSTAMTPQSSNVQRTIPSTPASQPMAVPQYTRNMSSSTATQQSQDYGRSSLINPAPTAASTMSTSSAMPTPAPAMPQYTGTTTQTPSTTPQYARSTTALTPSQSSSVSSSIASPSVSSQPTVTTRDWTPTPARETKTTRVYSTTPYGVTTSDSTSIPATQAKTESVPYTSPRPAATMTAQAQTPAPTIVSVPKPTTTSGLPAPVRSTPSTLVAMPTPTPVAPSAIAPKPAPILTVQAPMAAPTDASTSKLLVMPGFETPTTAKTDIKASSAPVPMVIPAPKPLEMLKTDKPAATASTATTTKAAPAITNAAPAPVIINAQEAKPIVPEPPKIVTMPAQPTDWRQSWGKADDHKPVTPPPAPPQMTVTKQTVHPAAPKVERKLPQADTTLPDPLQSTDQYAKRTLDSRMGLSSKTTSAAAQDDWKNLSRTPSTLATPVDRAKEMPKSPVKVASDNDWFKETPKAPSATAIQTDQFKQTIKPTVVTPIETMKPTVAIPMESVKPTVAAPTQLAKNESSLPLQPLPGTVQQKPTIVPAVETRSEDTPKSQVGVAVQEKASSSTVKSTKGESFLTSRPKAGSPETAPATAHYMPSPAESMPDIRIAPVPPGPPQVVPARLQRPYTGPQSKALGPTPLTNDPSAENAFVSTPSGAALARITNAFGPADPAAEAIANQAAAAQPVYSTNSFTTLPVTAPAAPVNMPNRGTMQASYQKPASPVENRQAVATTRATTTNVPQTLGVLRDSLYPSQRERAADSLANVDWHNNPAVLPALLTAAREDPAASVRAGCVRCLVKMKANTLPVVHAIQELKSDMDARVRQEAEFALQMLVPESTLLDKPAVQPAGAFVPGK